MDWTRVKGVVARGHGVASGLGEDKRFPDGTLALQKPYFKARGLDLGVYHPATINVSIAPCRFVVRQARHTFRNIKWTQEFPPEDFSFFTCRLWPKDGQAQEGLIYYPHPETKPAHFQAPDVLEIITTYIPELSYGDRLVVEVPDDQMQIVENR